MGVPSAVWRKTWGGLRSFLIAAAMGAPALAGDAAIAQEIPSFYTIGPQDIAGRPGTIIRTEPLSRDILPDAAAWRLLYRSTGLHGETVPVSAVLIVPKGAVPAGGRPVVAWQHPTSGVDRSCAPSLSPDVLRMIMGLPELLRRGYAVVATDYPGLGTTGPHPYLVGESEGRAVLDAVRAAREIPDAGAGERFAVWGHSQGGHATLYAGMLAEKYAPELRLVGVAAAAPASELATLLNAAAKTPDGQLLAAMLIWAWSRVYGAPMERLVPASEIPAVETLARVCFDPPFDGDAQPADKPMPPVRYRTIGALSETEPWRSLAARNTPGPLPAGIPVFLAQGSADTTIPPDVTEDYRQSLCRAGNAVRMVVMPGVDHRFIAREAAPAAIDWIESRFAGRPAPDDCR